MDFLDVNIFARSKLATSQSLCSANISSQKGRELQKYNTHMKVITDTWHDLQILLVEIQEYLCKLLNFII